MELESQNGSKIRLEERFEPFDFGRAFGYNSTDRTVSRHHISFKPHDDHSRVYFQVKGKNPVWVRDSRIDEIRVFRSMEAGEIKNGDSFCVSAKNPVWFILKKIGCEDQVCNEPKSDTRFDDALAETSGIDYDEIETGDISNIDPVKEFNFVIMGHEFDCYPKKMIRDIRNWDWFLEEPKEDSEEDEISERKAKKGIRKKRKKGGGDDEVWTGESEEEAEMIKKFRSIPKPKYSTRSKNQEKNKKGAGTSKSVKDATNRYAKDDENNDEDEEEEEDEEDDETLGGFIVDDEDAGEGNDDDEEEEEFEEDEDDDDE